MISRYVCVFVGSEATSFNSFQVGSKTEQHIPIFPSWSVLLQEEGAPRSGQVHYEFEETK